MPFAVDRNTTIVLICLCGVLVAVALAIVRKVRRAGHGKVAAHASGLGMNAELRAELGTPENVPVAVSGVQVGRDAKIQGTAVAVTASDIGRDLEIRQGNPPPPKAQPR